MEPVVTNPVVSPPLGGGLGDSAAGGGNAPVSQPRTFVEMASATAAAEAARLGTQPVIPAAPVSPPAAPAAAPVAPVAPVAAPVEPAGVLVPQDELDQMRELAQFGYQQRLLQQAQAQAVQPANAPANPFAPHPITGVVPFSEAEKSFLRTDEKGDVVAVPGAPADILVRWNAHVRTRQEYQNRLATEPEKIFETMIEKKAAEVAEKMYRESAARRSSEEAANRILEENKGWLFQHDAAGTMQLDVQGVPRLTPAGMLYKGFVDQMRSMGVTDPTAQHQFARLSVLGHMAEQRMSQPTAPIAPAQTAAPAQPAAPTKEMLEAQAKQNLLFQAQQAAAQAPATGGAMLTPPKRTNFMDFTRQKAREMGVTL